MVDIYDYESLLKRAREKVIPVVHSGERFQLPEADIIIEGKNTIFRNFMDFCKKMDRDPQHFSKFLFRELGTAGTIQGERLIFKGKVSLADIKDRINQYIKTYVLCYECGSPDTILKKEDRIEILVCKACGAIRPVTAHIEIKVQEEKIEEGKVYEVEIIDISRDGDGIAKKGSYTIYVPKAKKGQKLKVKIEKIKKNIAFGTIVQ
ncbi:MAG: translation initiation factor IF-2 subunit beta [Thermoplasmata archaeon]|jgi:translation initiation factor 2 subunit 2|nr:translation initiation factor IF-2 subunit beta [Thermoplasmatales archaeon]PMP73965.1 MAG: translation initiation factor IF-2 subunit beta [Aciduliprofundum sp.]